jgi:1-deoxy-D-xylulose-5-phosphate synthase
MPEWKTEMKEIKIGTGRKLKDGNDIAILSLGHPEILLLLPFVI